MPPAVAIATGTAVLLGLGTALVYPTLIAAMSDAVSPLERAPVIGVYRFWRDMSYALGYGDAIAIVAALTAASGLWVLFDMPSRPRTRVSSEERGRTSSLTRAAREPTRARR